MKTSYTYIKALFGKPYLLVCLSALLLLLQSRSVFSQVHGTGDYDPAKRSEWIKETVKKLKAFDPATAEKKQELKFREQDGEIHQSCRILNEGLVEFESGDWVYIILHSGHEQDSIGDIALAIDRKGKLFKHEGHVCGNICHYETVAPEKYTTSKDFFRYFKDDTEGLSWEKLKL